MRRASGYVAATPETRLPARLGCVFIACLAVCACSDYEPTIRYVAVAPVTAEDAGYDCRQIEAALLKVDTVRWVVREDGGSLESTGEKTARFAANVLLILGGNMMGDEGSAVLEAADQRIMVLLRLKRTRGCPPTPTAEPGMTDLQMLEVLEPLMAVPERRDRETLDRRTALLDHLRIPPTPPAMPAATEAAPQRRQ